MQPVKVGDAGPLNVYWTTFFVHTVRAVRVNFVEDVSLWEHPTCTQGVYVFSLAPLGELGEHEFHFGFIKLPRATKPQDVCLVEY